MPTTADSPALHHPNLSRSLNPSCGRLRTAVTSAIVSACDMRVQAADDSDRNSQPSPPLASVRSGHLTIITVALPEFSAL